MMITHNDGAIVDDVEAASTGDFAIKRKHPRKKNRENRFSTATKRIRINLSNPMPLPVLGKLLINTALS
jgi:hypothetical protein